LHEDSELFLKLREELLVGLRAELNDIEVIAENSLRLPNTLNIRFIETDAEAIMANAPSIMVSSGSACTARIPEASHVLVAMGMTQEEASECLRFSVGRHTTLEQIGHAVTEISAAVYRVRELNT
jgi:cysteine desulfurase